MENYKLVYVAGPFRDHDTGDAGRYNFWGQHQNIERAAKLALKVWSLPYTAALCPHLNTAPYQGSLPDITWLDGDLEMVRRCDAVVLVEGWQQSTGTLEEIRIARNRGIPVFERFKDLVRWRREIADCGEMPESASVERGL